MKHLRINIWIVMLSLSGALALAACDTGGQPATPGTPTVAPTAAIPTSPPATIEPTRPVAIATRASTPRAQATSQSGGDGWQTFTSSEGGFSVDMPGKPSETAQPASGGSTAYVFTVSRGSYSYIVGYTDLPASSSGIDPEQFLDSAREGTINRTGGELVREEKITLGEYPGRDFTLKIELLDSSLRQRVYRVGTRMYQLITTGPGSDVNSDDAERFFNSFTLGGTPQPTQGTIGRTPTPQAIATLGGGDTGGDWREITPRDGGFSIELPGEPVAGTQSRPVGADTMEIKTFTLSTEKESYTITYSDFPPEAIQSDANTMLEGALGGVSAQGTLVNHKTITVDGSPGIEGEFEVPGIGYSWYKGVFVGERLYQLIFIAQNKDVSAQDARRFLDSFKLTQ